MNHHNKGQKQTVKFYLSGKARVTYDMVLEIPVGISDAELDVLANEIYDDTPGDEFSIDVDNWWNGKAHWEKIKEPIE